METPSKCVLNMNSKDTGNLGEHLAILECLKLGIIVSRPLGDNARYDLILDINGKLLTAQVKTNNRAEEDMVSFPLTSSQAHRGKGRQTYDVDVFLLVDLYRENVFLLKASEDKKSIILRYTTTRTARSNLAQDYLLRSCVETLHDTSRLLDEDKVQTPN